MWAGFRRASVRRLGFDRHLLDHSVLRHQHADPPHRAIPSLAILQFTAGIIVTVVLIVPMLLFIGGLSDRNARPSSPNWSTICPIVLLILPWPPLMGQLGALVVAIFNDHSPTPVFPRSLAYFNLWVAVLLLPATMIIFFTTGPFAWTGVIGFWIPAAVLGLWYIVISVYLPRSIRNEAESDLAPVHA